MIEIQKKTGSWDYISSNPAISTTSLWAKRKDTMYLQSQKHSFSHECWENAEWTVTPKGILHVAQVSFKYANWRVDLPVRQCLFMSDVQFKIYIYHIRNEAHCLSWRSLQSRNFSSLSKVSLNGLKSIFSNSSTS